jgi:hypothetical protein
MGVNDEDCWHEEKAVDDLWDEQEDVEEDGLELLDENDCDVG